MYDALEQMLLRVAKLFENNIDDEQGGQSALLTRLAIGIDGCSSSGGGAKRAHIVHALICEQTLDGSYRPIPG